jgi:hypothetical protein
LVATEPSPDATTIKLQDEVIVDNMRYKVIGTVEFTSGVPWIEHWLEPLQPNGDTTQRILAHDPDGIDLVLWTRRELPEGVEAGARTIVADGETFTLSRDYESDYTSVGDAPLLRTGRVAAYVYRGPGDSVSAAFERYDDSPWVFSTGVEVTEIEVYAS